jgi:Ca2+:H+ antiporter
MAARAGLSLPAIAFPVLALGFVVLAAAVGFNIVAPTSPLSWVLSTAMVAIMLGAVFAAVELADVIAHRVGEPYGTLVLTLAVTVIEVALIESIVLTPNSPPALARDTVFAVIMIVCNGLVGLCIMVGSLRHHEQEFQVSGASLYLNVLGALSVLTLILPAASIIMLLMALTGVILLSKKFAVILEIGLNRLGAPQAVAGIVIAMVVLAPESITALRAAQRNMLQKSLNLALGSSLATIGLTIPAVAVTNVLLDKPIEVGLSSRDALLLALTLFLSRRAQHHHVGAAHRAPGAAARIDERIGHPWHQRSVVEANDQFGPHNDAAALAAHEPHHVGILAARRHEIDHGRGAVRRLNLGFEDQR